MMFIVEEYADNNERHYRLLDIVQLALLLDDIMDKVQRNIDDKNVPKIVVYKLGEELLDWS